MHKCRRCAQVCDCDDDPEMTLAPVDCSHDCASSRGYPSAYAELSVDDADDDEGFEDEFTYDDEDETDEDDGN